LLCCGPGLGGSTLVQSYRVPLDIYVGFTRFVSLNTTGAGLLFSWDYTLLQQRDYLETRVTFLLSQWAPAALHITLSLPARRGAHVVIVPRVVLNYVSPHAPLGSLVLGLGPAVVPKP
jgi:hypothetical protein